MAAALFRLMALLALMLMPHGLASAPAMAEPGNHATSAGHCEDQAEHDKAPAKSHVDCAMACNALPASEPSVEEPLPMPIALRAIAPEIRFSSIVPETATPPPKLF